MPGTPVANRPGSRHDDHPYDSGSLARRRRRSVRSRLAQPVVVLRCVFCSAYGTSKDARPYRRERPRTSSRSNALVG